MKCIKSIRATKNVEVGEIKRINDVEAEIRVRGGNWAYVPKIEWKKTKSVVKEVVTNTSEEPTVSEKQLKSKKRKSEK